MTETFGEAGFLFDIPERYTTEMVDLPDAADVAPWIEMIERLWDGPVLHDDHRAKSLERAKAWQADNLRPPIESFFRVVANGR